jgi:hypothetical protein
MPVRYHHPDPRACRPSSWPDEIAVEDAVTHFTLPPTTSRLAGFNRRWHNHVGVAVNYRRCRGWRLIPDDLADCPATALDRLAAALAIAPGTDSKGRPPRDAAEPGPPPARAAAATAEADAAGRPARRRPDQGPDPPHPGAAGATVATPELLKAELHKLEFLRRYGADHLDLSRLPVGRRRMLAEIGRRATNQALQRAAVDRRHPVLLATLAETYVEVLDELVQLLDQALAGADSRARHELQQLVDRQGKGRSCPAARRDPRRARRPERPR